MTSELRANQISVSLSLSLFLSLSVCLSVCLSVSLSVCLSISQSCIIHDRSGSPQMMPCILLVYSCCVRVCTAACPCTWRWSQGPGGWLPSSAMCRWSVHSVLDSVNMLTQPHTTHMHRQQWTVGMTNLTHYHEYGA